MGDLEIVLGALREGARIEEEGMRFYKEAAGKVEDINGKATLEYLAKEEARHRRFIEDLESSLRAGKPEAVTIIEGPEHPRIFPEKQEYPEGVKTEGDLEVLEEAKKVEERSIAFYQGFAGRVREEEYRKVFEALVREEESHLEWIHFMMDGLKVYGYWYGLEDYMANE
ncbi:MAG: ferritin family protein [Euryarchaeota archaeon]|nr:ferritin family protein [Euryarchaeota archaeon]